MPIRPELRPLYRGAKWRNTRRLLLKDAGGRFERGKRGAWHYRGGARCEYCHKPDRTLVRVYCGQIDGEPCCFWALPYTDPVWWDHHGRKLDRWPPLPGLPRQIRVVLTVAHLNHVAGDDREENLRVLCQWCHLNYDKLHHKETRCQRKDARRPLLASA